MNRGIQRLGALIRKETIQLLRDWRTLAFLFGLPFIELFLFAYAVSLTVYHLPTATVDLSRDSRSRDLIQALVDSQYFDVSQTAADETEAIRLIDQGVVKAAIVIPADIAAKVEKGDANVLVLIDGSDSFSVQSGYSGASTVLQNYSMGITVEEILRRGGTAGPSALTTTTRVLYNPDMKDLWFVLPAIIGMIMQTVAVGQAAMVLVKEKEVGTMEQILVTPTRPIEFILGKMIPLVVLCCLVTSIVLGLGVFWFGVPFQGDLGLYALLALVFIVSSLALGMLISTISKTQRQAQQITTMLMLFSMLLSGIVYPRNAMPFLPYWIGNLLPLTYFIRISRGIITKGIGLQFLWSDAVILSVYGAIVLVVASFTFRRRLDG